MQVTFATILHSTVVVSGPVLRKLKHSRTIARKRKKGYKFVHVRLSPMSQIYV